MNYYVNFLHQSKLAARISIMRTTNADSLLKAMNPGQVYRRAELAQFSKAVDRDLKALVKKGLLRRPAAGLYYRPEQSRWGEVPAETHELVRAFLNTDDFLVTSLNVFNQLGVGLTQMVNATMIYNRKRAGKFVLGGRTFEFKRPVNYPSKMTKEFLYVDLLNNFEDLPERPENLEILLKKRLMEVSSKKLERCARFYGKTRTQKMLRELTANAE